MTDVDDGSTATITQPAPVAASSVTEPVPTTSVMAILALIAGFVAPLVGVVLGIVGLVRLKRSGKKGKGLAITGIVLGTIGTFVIAAIVAASALFTAAVVDASGTSDASAIVGDIAQEVLPDTKLTANVGDCTAALTDTYLTTLPIVDCAQPHANEVYSLTSLTGDAFPGVDAVNAAAEAACTPDFEAFIGMPYAESSYEMYFSTPTEHNWNAIDDRQVICMVGDPSGDTTGSLRGTAR